MGYEHRQRVEEVATVIVDAAVSVHQALGPGLLESAYQKILGYELGRRGLKVEREVKVPLLYRDLRLDLGYRLNLLVEGCGIVENKTVDRFLPIHHAQLLTYLKTTGHRLGVLINWNVPVLRQGIRRVVLDL
jgi:GxxExxY protein